MFSPIVTAQELSLLCGAGAGATTPPVTRLEAWPQVHVNKNPIRSLYFHNSNKIKITKNGDKCDTNSYIILRTFFCV